ncbi:BTB/POZ domain-containing protein KCTD21 [Bombina bombina]|uniref:BTB/POZ domain-containing protein KCTD21 n=1 Tax=Bombina bombina TaxID=8345 RepID=UPI00235A5DF2|nr:BTB/POZ domain-containing protein KCTD21 [Bombina bombina]
MSDPVTLNVGGKLYTTSLSTLTRIPDTMLGAMFSGKVPSKKDSHGNFFIDRDGKVFRHILNFLRSSHLDLPDDFQEMSLLRREVDFYQIQPLIDAFQEKEAELLKSGKIVILTIGVEQTRKSISVCEEYLAFKQPYNIDVLKANIYCTSTLFLDQLKSKFRYYMNGLFSVIPNSQGHHQRLNLDWVANVDGFDENDYTKLRLARLFVSPEKIQINRSQEFTEELLKTALNYGFQVVSAKSQTMNNTFIRLIRYK